MTIICCRAARDHQHGGQVRPGKCWFFSSLRSGRVGGGYWTFVLSSAFWVSSVLKARRNSDSNQQDDVGFELSWFQSFKTVSCSRVSRFLLSEWYLSRLNQQVSFTVSRSTSNVGQVWPCLQQATCTCSVRSCWWYILHSCANANSTYDNVSVFCSAMKYLSPQKIVNQPDASPSVNDLGWFAITSLTSDRYHSHLQPPLSEVIPRSQYPGITPQIIIVKKCHRQDCSSQHRGHSRLHSLGSAVIPQPITHSHTNTLYHTVEHRTGDFSRSPHLNDKGCVALGLTQTFTPGSSTALTPVPYGHLHSSCTGRKKALCVNQNWPSLEFLTMCNLDRH